MWTKEDEAFMQHALDVAERGRGRVAPNPLVGCVLVKKGEIIAEGWHDHLGGLHAEQMAIHDAESKGRSPNGATAYVTLEPCNHYGRTPPCTEALLWSGVKHVIVAHPDPNPTVRGKGFQVLRDAGISVQSGLLEKEAAEQMKPFLHWCEHRRPMVTVKLAIDANSSVDDRSEEAQRFTSEACLDEVHRLRMDCDAILVGAETVERDNPSLTVRRFETERQPLRVILDPKERTNQEATVYTDGYDTIQVGADYNGLLPLLNRLGDMEKQRLLIEGGPKTIHSFLSEELVDEFYLVQSNVVHHEPVPSNIDAHRLTQSGLTLDHTETWGEETVQVWIRTPSQ
ncbi:MAG: bifunctional diaminohydroxyphosphoribosylaminopyrimidine deaminase/5-amino-6-(5-phosphoribosylamino)uracil reductase RibD [Methanobacteriota archaeon]|nr:MAG: riboflavin biosynthesis protein RibD [Euryarchaeota archaeon TMED103]RAH12939.1 MAG: bifunctional diaminohydroxyphosphoribosylaminopyrimidine deaminase/5-amino-6-(5-phosphoribosylamino)uracil reductase RibD [Euryarchaeota archaeon]|tara:strand:- start:1337 stop:2359 length:1023 start_codon:yes stop_codon:yes gene_type:complete